VSLSHNKRTRQMRGLGTHKFGNESGRGAKVDKSGSNNGGRVMVGFIGRLMKKWVLAQFIRTS
jgi:hypothetical protein